MWSLSGRRCFVALIAAAALAAVPTVAQAAPRAPFGHEGRWITDASGRAVVLHGWNMVNKLPPYRPDALGFGRDDARFLRRQGFNTVRLGIIFAGLSPSPGQIDEAYLERIATTARVLTDEGIFVLLDFHQDMYNERFNGEGFPDWAVVGDAATLPAQPDVGFPGNYLVMPALWRAYDYFWANAAGPGGVGLQDRYAVAWRHVAQRFRDVPGVFGYDIFNEPWPGTGWPTCAQPVGCPVFDQGELTSFSKRVFAEIRKADPRKLVWWEPLLTFDFGADTYHGDTGDSRAGMSFHVYCLGELPGAAPPPAFETGGCQTAEERVFDQARTVSDETGDALLLTEFAATDTTASIERVANEADANEVGWQQWAYFNEDPCCERPVEGLIVDPSKPPTSGNVKQAKLDVSVRPYPHAVAGTPRSFGFDRHNRTFDLSYSTARLGGGSFASCAETEIWVPRRHYPSGYGMTLNGAEPVSAPGAELLRLVNLPGAERVTLQVTRGGSVPTRSTRCGRTTTRKRAGRIRLTVSPRVVRSGERRRFRFSATLATGGQKLPGATIRFAGRLARTGGDGRASIVARLTRPGKHPARASRADLVSDTATVTVRRARRRPRFTG